MNGRSLQFTTSKSFPQALIWGNEGSMNLYGNTPDDDASDLRLRAYGKSKLTMPISSNLGVSLYATGLLVKGRSVENDVWGHGWNIGASVDILGTFNLESIRRIDVKMELSVYGWQLVVLT